VSDNVVCLSVGIATLAGSILARHRACLRAIGRLLHSLSLSILGNIFLRTTLPPALFLLSLAHFLPRTASNLADQATALEHSYLPSLAGARAQATEFVKTSLSRAK
jgi:organizing structure protein 2